MGLVVRSHRPVCLPDRPIGLPTSGAPWSEGLVEPLTSRCESVTDGCFDSYQVWEISNRLRIAF